MTAVDLLFMCGGLPLYVGLPPNLTRLLSEARCTRWPPLSPPRVYPASTQCHWLRLTRLWVSNCPASFLQRPKTQRVYHIYGVSNFLQTRRMRLNLETFLFPTDNLTTISKEAGWDFMDELWWWKARCSIAQQYSSCQHLHGEGQEEKGQRKM